MTHHKLGSAAATPFPVVPLRVLLVEDSEDDATLLLVELARGGYDVTSERVETAEAMEAALERDAWDLVLSDYRLPGFNAPAALALVKRLGLDVPFIIASGAVGEETAVECLKAGAHDFVVKDNLSRLVPAVRRELREVEVRRAAARAEAALRASEERSRLVAERAELARAEAERANHAKSEFVAMMSHELRTPLAAILGYSEILADEVVGPLNDVQKDELRRIHSNGEHLLELIDGLLDFGALEGGHVRYAIADVAVRDLLAACDALIAPLAREKGIEYAVEACDPALAVRGDATKVRQVLGNLLSNAVKFTASGGRITLDCVADASTVRIRITDTGRGVPADKFDDIFRPFVQADAVMTRQHGGVGLGLAISSDLAHDMDGELVLERSDGSGSVFALVLPRAGAPVGGAFRQLARDDSTREVASGR